MTHNDADQPTDRAATHTKLGSTVAKNARLLASKNAASQRAISNPRARAAAVGRKIPKVG
jgi:hypothetical protein